MSNNETNIDGKMMEKRYQVFISSTYSDLQVERRCVMDAVLTKKCFPSGMEMFPAVDMKQFNYIKSVIDESDYYVLILAGRYGSVDDDGISYTEKEYDYAVSKKIPIIVLLHQNPSSLSQEKMETDIEKKKKLENFYTKAKDGRLVAFWSNPDELKFKLSQSLDAAIKECPREGWVRGIAEQRTQITEKDFQVCYDKKRAAVYKCYEDGRREGPYCVRCWEVDEKLFTVNEIIVGAKRSYRCLKCNTKVDVEIMNRFKNTSRVIKSKYNWLDE